MGCYISFLSVTLQCVTLQCNITVLTKNPKYQLLHGDELGTKK